MSDAADAAAKKKAAAAASNKAPSASSLTKAWNEAGKPALVNGTPYVKHNGVLYRKEGGKWVAAPRSGNPSTWGPVEREKFVNKISASAAEVKKMEEDQKLREFNKLSPEEQAKLKAAAESGKRGRGRPSKKLTLQDVAKGKTSVQKTNEELDAIAAEKKAKAKAKALTAVSGKEYAGISMVDPKTGKAYTFDAKGNRHEAGTEGYRKAMAAGRKSGRGQAQKPAAERTVPTRRSPAASAAVRRAQEGLVADAMKKGQAASQSKPKAPAKPKIDRSAEKPLTSKSSGLSDAELKAKLEAAKFKVENAAKPKSQAPRSKAKGNTPAADSKPSTTPSRARNKAPKVEKPVSPRLEMKSEFSKIKRNIETSIRQGERKAAPKPSSLQRSVAAIDKAKAKIDADVKSGKISKKQGATAKRNLSARTQQVVKRDETIKANRAAKAAAEAPKVETPAKKTTVKKTEAKKTAPSSSKTSAKRPPRKPAGSPAPKQTPAQKAAATRAANKAKAQSKRLPGNTFEEKLKNFKGERVPAGAKWIKVGNKVVRAAAPAARVLGRVAGPAGIALTAAEAVRLGTTMQGQREYADMRRAIDMGMRGKDVKGRDLVRKGTMYTATADAKKEADTAKRKKLASASAKAGDARAQAMNRSAYRYTVKKGPRPSGESYTPSKKQDSSGKGANRPSAPMTGRAVRVQRGGTMWDIAQKNKTTVSALYKANPELARRKAAGKTVIYRNTLVKIPGKK